MGGKGREGLSSMAEGGGSIGGHGNQCGLYAAGVSWDRGSISAYGAGSERLDTVRFVRALNIR